MSDEIQRKHRREHEAVINDALRDSMKHLIQAHNRFGSAIRDSGLNNQFSEGVDQAQQVLLALGVEL